ncbi:MAG: biotin--[Clostridia bacterium]|nr:biotin--[acetyl-CoA-carboxylase] ligase [Clostridia bacterium]
MQISEVYNADVLRSLLPESADAICIKETESTNTIARELICKGASNGSLLIADRQTAGRGRRGKSFFSPDGGIYMSVIVRERDAVPYTVCAAAAVCKALRSLGAKTEIKWVNDIFIDGKKVCGILCERVEEHIIIGIGINHSITDFPEELNDIAASLPKEFPDRQKTAAAVIKELFRSLADPTAARAYYAKNMMLYGKTVSYEYNGNTHTGKIIGLGENEELLVESGSKHIALTSGMVTPVEADK